MDETDSFHKLKIGDGVHYYEDLPYFKSEEEILEDVKELLPEGSGLENVTLGLNEPAPEDTVPSICDFELIPTTPSATYSLFYNNVVPYGYAGEGGVFMGHEIPLITTKGTLSVIDKKGNTTIEKYVDQLINYRDITDVLTNKGISKKWSEKFYLTKDPNPTKTEFIDYSPGLSNWIYTFEFTEEDFEEAALPAKKDNIPIVSPAFYTESDAISKIKWRVYGAGMSPATFSWDGEKYIFKIRVLDKADIKSQLQQYTKTYFYYELAKPYEMIAPVALGMSDGDRVIFTIDDSDWKTYLDWKHPTNGTPDFYRDVNGKGIDKADAMPNLLT
jgi:hypothetical protein